jgi:hypothetical protein
MSWLALLKVAREFDGVELVGIESPPWPKSYASAFV